MTEKFSHIIDMFIHPTGELYEKGFLHGTNSIDEDLFDLVDDVHINEGTYQKVLDRCTSDKILNNFFVNNPDVAKIIEMYKCKCEYDISYYFTTKLNKPSNHRNSQLWHHDSVGHRLKLFIGLNHGWKTYYIEGSHKKNNFFSSFQDENKRIALGKKIKSKNYGKLMVLKKGGWLIFDTNGLHKGFTDKNFHGSILVYEFSNKHKKPWMGKVGRRNKL